MMFLSETGSTAFDTVKTAFETGIGQVASNATGMITSALPVALGIFALTFAIRKGMGFFRSVAGKN